MSEPTKSSPESLDTRPEEADTDSSDEEGSSDSEYMSFGESDDEDGDHEETKAEREARAHERQLVLEAAGLIVKEDVKPPADVVRSRSLRKRRPPPAAPQKSTAATTSPAKELPRVPEPSAEESAARLDDAFDRYENYKQAHETSNNRLSVISVDTTQSSPPVSPSPTQGSTREGDSKSYSSLLHFLGRRTPNDGEKRTMPIISGPIMQQKSSDNSSDSSATFGSVSASRCYDGV